ncbi:hypothetical protein [Alishewanella sp. HL-SH05]|uniref:hypothetical protein n=1 Tax=Alishewanella sp. HL-SH05 TaxID=3461145 RepID=UPI004040F21A
MKLIFIALFALTFQAHAGCDISEETQRDYNQKYGDHISIETTLRDSSYYVVASLPTAIDNQKFKAVWLFADSVDEPSFVAPLETFQEGDMFLAWYEIDAGLIRRHFVAAKFGEDCGTSVIKEIFYK